MTRKQLDIHKAFINKTLEEDIQHVLKKDNINYVINCAGITNKKNLQNEIFIVNSYFPLLLDNICYKNSIKLIHPSTDCVFSGKKGDYIEEDFPDPYDNYGISKYLGERLQFSCVIRVSIVGECAKDKSSLIEWVKSNKNGTIYGYTNHYWNGITCLEYAKIIYEIISSDSLWIGCKHFKSINSIAKYDLVKMINDVYNLNINIIKKEHEQINNRTLNTNNNNNQYNTVRKNLYEQLIELKEFNIISKFTYT